MVSVLMFVFGILDIIAGGILTLSSTTFLPEIAKYIGIFLIFKGVWTLATAFAG